MKKVVLAFWMIITICITLTYAAIQGDFVINVVDATTATKFYRVPGSVANGMRVDVTRISAGTKTPADNFVNPTDAITTWNLLAGYDGATWDRLRVSTVNTGYLKTEATLMSAAGSEVGIGTNAADGVATSGQSLNTKNFQYLYNGVTWDRVRGNTTDGTQVYNGRVSATVVSMFTGTINSIIVSDVSSTRRMLLIYNESINDCYLKLASGATTTNYSFKLITGEYWEMPSVVYSGIVSAVCSGGTNTLAVTAY